ncbi:MAG: aminotransferase class I/II-fold pyridoxal phosphate-dependent enzyme, partial [bacterium]|nr:aminotransferase class I/II-fold pyridoxal phosphate-dependent enzyme [bacterium]
MNIPLVDLKAQYRTIAAEIDAAIAAVIADTAFVGGPYASRFEDSFAEYCQARHCIGVGNGTDALAVALRAAGIGPDDEVLVPANSFIATSEAVTMAGGRVTFVDVDPVTYNLDLEQVEARLTPRTRAIIPVHLYGQPAPMDAVA